MVKTINGGSGPSRGRRPNQSFFPDGSIATFETRQQGGTLMETRTGSLGVDGDFFSGPVGMDYTPPQSMVNEGLTKPEVNIFNPPDEPLLSDSERLVKSAETQTDILQKRQDQQNAIAGARLFANVMNAQSQYAAIESNSITNIFLANQSAADAISRGKQQSLQLETQGKNQGEMAKLSMAAQGQDVQGAGVDKIVAGQEAVGIYNGMIAEMNASREALGFEQEAIQYMGRIEQAEIQRNFSILSSALQFGAATVPLG